MGTRFTVTIVVALVASLAVGHVVGRPPRPGTEGNALSENESATLWSGDDDSQYISNADYRDAYGERRTTMQQIANGTDLTFTRPPATAARWTRHDHGDFPSGNRNSSVFPPETTLTDGTHIVDAHATVFNVAPATVTHHSPNGSSRYVAPNGTLRGVIDYRIRIPNDTDTWGESIEWTVRDHRISDIRLVANGNTIARSDGTYTPALSYNLGTKETVDQLRLEVDIEAELTREQTVRERIMRTLPNGTEREVIHRYTDSKTVHDEVTVSDTIAITPYDLQATLRYTRYPNGDDGVAVYKNLPWQGLDLSANGEQRVRGVWRFYTARNPEWDVLRRSTADGFEQIESPSIPVAVNAYPSRLGTRVEPTSDGPTLLRVWGTEHESPEATIPENITVDVVDDPYETSFGLAARTNDLDRSELTALGIVRGVNGTLVEPNSGSQRRLHESDLELSILEQSADGATLLVTLQGTESGAPIALGDQTSRNDPVIPEGRSGYVTVDGSRVETNVSGMATIHVTDPGVYTARYHPGSWLSQEPAYTASSGTTRWHPLGTIAGWVSLVMTVLIWSIPFLAAVYAGRRIGDFIGSSNRNS